MEKSKKIMIAENNDFGQNCSRALSACGYSVTLLEKDGSQVLTRVKYDTPDILIMDAFMLHIDALGVMKRMKDMSEIKMPVIVVLSGVDNSHFLSESR